MFEERAARESLFGYQEVHNANWKGFELPDFRLMQMLTSRKKDKAIRLMAELEEAVLSVIGQVESLASSSGLPEQLVENIIDYGVKLLKPEFHTEVLQTPETLRKAALLGFHLGLLDRNRIGENPAVALGAHKKALGKLCERNFMVGEDDMTPTKTACLYIAEASFYASRRFKLEI
jgi:hypothetical protein